MPLPLWAAIVGVSLAKKALFLAAAKVYGIPRLYRKTQKVARWSFQDPGTRHYVAVRIRNAYRYPGSLAARVLGPGPTVARSVQQSAAKSASRPELQQSLHHSLITKSSFAVSALKHAPSARKLRKTLQSGQHYLQHLRGASVPGLAQQAVLQNSNMRLSSPMAAATLAHLRKPFNYVLGQSMGHA